MSTDNPVSERRVLRLYVFAIATYGFDYKASVSGAGAAMQTLLLLIFIVCFIRIVSAGARRGIGVGPLWVLLLMAALFMIDSATVGLINDQALFRVLANLIPFSLYIGASVLTYVTLSIVKDHRPAFLNGLRLACIASAVFHVVVLVMTRGAIDLSTSRYEVLSGAVVPSLGILPVGLAQPLSMLDIFVVLLNLALAVVSVTRTLVISLAVQVAALFVARPGIIARASVLKGVGVTSLVIIAIVAGDFAAGTGLTSRWTERLFLSQKLGSDPSGLSRIAETQFMWQHFVSSPQTVVFGNGIAAVTSMEGRAAARNEMLIGDQKRTGALHSSGIGHENYVGILYVAGLLGGGGLLTIQFMNALQSLLVIRELQRRPSPYRAADVHLGIWGGVIVMGMLTLCFLGPVFADRDECLWLGIGTGMLYWARELVSKTIAAESVVLAHPAT
jgi:hypothetical protein